MRSVSGESAPTSRPARNPGIDLLRGLSIVLVVLHHVGMRIPLHKGVLATLFPTWFLKGLIFNGYEAVFIFFVVSGFLIASNSLGRWGSLQAIDLPAFYGRRASRILPCLLALLAVLSLLHLVGARDYVIARSGQSLGGALSSALGLHLNWYEGRLGYLPGNWDVLWSLSIEEVFYLAFPLVCLGLRRHRFLVPALLLLALSLPLTRGALEGNEIWQEKAYLPGMAGIATGVLAALAETRWRTWGPRLRTPFFLLGAAGLLAILFMEGRLWVHLGNGTLLILTGSAALLALASAWRAPWRIPGTAWLQSFGRLSYEVYLTHMFVVWPVVRAFKALPAFAPWGFLWHLPALAASWALGWLVARHVSQPCERALRRRFAERRERSIPPLEPVVG